MSPSGYGRYFIGGESMAGDRTETTAAGMPIYCAFSEIAAIDSLVPNLRNPNTHPEKQVKLLAKVIKNQGWRVPITVSNRSGFIVRGHGRLLAAKMLGVEQELIFY